MKILDTGTVLEKVLLTVYSRTEVEECERYDKNDLMDLAIEIGGIEVLEEVTKEIYEQE